MNPDTRVSVHCYEGDGHQVRNALPLYLHHGCPVTVVSPIDSRVQIDHPGIECRFAGQREGSVMNWRVNRETRIVSGGPLCKERQRQQMEMLLSYPENFFFMNDSDSFCLSPKLPDYLYNEPDIVWSNLVFDPAPDNQIHYKTRPNFPRIAFQPPLFMSRRTIETLLAVSPRVPMDDFLPWIDHWLVQLAVEAKLVWKGFPDIISADLDRFPGVLENAQCQVRHLGRIFVHSAKTVEAWGPLMHAHRQFLTDYRGGCDHRPNPDTNTTADIAPVGQERMRKETPHDPT